MSLVTLLEVSLALVFFFTVMSIVVSAINEAVSNWRGQRGRFLQNALVGMVGGDGKEGDKTLRRLKDHPLYQSLAAPGKSPSYLSQVAFLEIYLDLIAPASAPSTGSLGTLRANEAAGKSSLFTFLDSAQVSDSIRALLKSFVPVSGLEGFLQRLGQWFDEAMDRVTGQYKRRTQTLSLLIGLGLAAALNLDSLALTGRLLDDKDQRQKIVEAAVEYHTKASVAASPELATRLDSQAVKALDSLEGAALVGWSDQELRQAFPGGQNIDFWPLVGLWFAKVLGWLVTGFALSLGAPYWFEILGRLASLKGAGPQTKAG